MSNAATASEKKPRKKKEAVADPDSTQPGEGDATTKKTRRQPASAAPAPAKRASIPVTRVWPGVSALEELQSGAPASEATKGALQGLYACMLEPSLLPYFWLAEHKEVLANFGPEPTSTALSSSPAFIELLQSVDADASPDVLKRIADRRRARLWQTQRYLQDAVNVFHADIENANAVMDSSEAAIKHVADQANSAKAISSDPPTALSTDSPMEISADSAGLVADSGSL